MVRRMSVEEEEELDGLTAEAPVETRARARVPG
jgi:hypothetical protein